MIRSAAVVAGSVLAVVAPLAAVAHAPAAPTPVGVHAQHSDHAASQQAAPATVPTLSLAPRSRGLPRLRGTVGPGNTITVSRHRVPPGRYRLVVIDESSAHNWHIQGRRVDRATSVVGTGRSVWRVRLRVGRYPIVCDVHATTMRTRVRVIRG